MVHQKSLESTNLCEDNHLFIMNMVIRDLKDENGFRFVNRYKHDM